MINFIINLGEIIKKDNTRILKIIEILEDLQIKQKKLLDKLEQYFDFIKIQQSGIDRKSKS